MSNPIVTASGTGTSSTRPVPEGRPTRTDSAPSGAAPIWDCRSSASTEEQGSRRCGARALTFATCATDPARGAHLREWALREPCSPAEGGADVCWTRANANRDEVGQRDLAERRPRSANREAEAVTRRQSAAATPWRSTLVTRLFAGLDEPRPRPHRPELVLSCMWQIVGTPPHGRGSRPTLSTLATSTAPLRQPRGGRPRPNGLLFGPEPPSGTSDRTRRRGDDEDRFRGRPESRTARTHVLASAPLGRSEPSVVTPSFPLHWCS